jgi:hypothetical protein
MGHRHTREEYDEVLSQLEGWKRAPDSSEFCDALCDAAEFLGLPEGEYQYDDLVARIDRCYQADLSWAGSDF